jgi:hypothetical protein
LSANRPNELSQTIAEIDRIREYYNFVNMLIQHIPKDFFAGKMF